MKLINVINPAVDLRQLVQLCQPDDIILLRQDAVYLSLKPGLALAGICCYVLGTDLTARQLTPQPEFTVIDDATWVKLTSEAQQSLLW
ncbi:DsrH/TusB family sulfur metabolism protein [Chromatiaceae bacterium AAb-1]|nr:DsrH/TusB family sulfur metabolism protein [Chromatiaceae bacterium AAb-1]